MSVLIPRDAVLEILKNNQWHPLREFLRLGLDIPPELACRQYIGIFKRDQELPDMDLDRQISKGRSHAVSERLRGLARRDYLIIRNQGSGKEYKRTRKC